MNIYYNISIGFRLNFAFRAFEIDQVVFINNSIDDSDTSGYVLVCSVWCVPIDRISDKIPIDRISDKICDKICDSNFGSDLLYDQINFNIKSFFDLCMYMHGSTLVFKILIELGPALFQIVFAGYYMILHYVYYIFL